MVSGRGRGKTQLSTKKVTFGAPGGVFGDFHEKTMISQLFPPFGENSTFPPPPYAKPCYGNAFSMVLGGTFHPNREMLLVLVISSLFLFFLLFAMEMRENVRKTEK